jgi:hypothetical protein
MNQPTRRSGCLSFKNYPTNPSPFIIHHHHLPTPLPFFNTTTFNQGYDASNGPNYVTAAATPSPLPPRHFCSVCGYWGRHACARCGMRYCCLKCQETHKVRLKTDMWWGLVHGPQADERICVGGANVNGYVAVVWCFDWLIDTYVCY